MASQRQHVLRVGVVWQGQLVVERVLDRRCDLTVGTDAHCTIRLDPSLPGIPPACARIAVLVGGDYHAALGPTTELTLRGGQAHARSAAPLRGQQGTALVSIESALGGSWRDAALTVLFQRVQPEAMVVDVREQAVLRVTLVHDGRELATRTLLARERLCIGSAQSDDLVLPMTDYQGPGIRLQLDRGGAGQGEVPKSAGLKLAREEDPPLDADAALAARQLRDLGSHWLVHLPMGTRCRAALGPYVVLVEVRQESVVRPRLRSQPLHQRVGKWLRSDATWNVSLGATALVVGALAVQAAMVQKTTLRFLERAPADEPAEVALYPVDVPALAEPVPMPDPVVKPPVDLRPAPPPEAEQSAPSDDHRLRATPPRTAPVRTAERPVSVSREAGPTAKPRNIGAAIRDGIGASRLAFADDDSAAPRPEVFGRRGDADAAQGAGPGSGPGAAARVGDSAGGVERIDSKPALPRRTVENAEVAPPKSETIVVKTPKVEPADPNDPAADLVGRALARKHGAVRRCYERALRDQSSLSGKLRAHFVVTADGGVDQVQVASADPVLAECVRGVLLSLRGLPSSAAGQRYAQSYVFSQAQ